MNEPTPNASPPAAEAPPSAIATPPAAAIALRPWHVGVLSAVLLALALAALNLASRLSDVHRTTTQQAADQNEALAAAQKDLAESRKKIEALDGELDRLKDQRADLEQFVVEINRGRDEALLIEVERLVNAAANELQLSGNVPAAIVALSAADARLARADRAPLLTLRRSIARDLDRLRALPTIDVTGIALRLDGIAEGIDAWPMLSDPGAPLAGASAARKDPSNRAAAKAAPATAPETSFWDSVRRWLGEEFGDLVRIREVQTPESVLLSTTQRQLIRHQMRLRLFDARQALIARNDKLYRSDLLESRVLLLRYFDLKQAAPAAALAQIDKLSAVATSLEIPQAGLAESLAALAAARVPRAAGRNP